MAGQIIGNLLNVVLDPLLILGMGWGIAGAAAATVVGNMVSALYYLLFYLRGRSCLSIHPRHFTFRGGVCTGVLAIGFPQCLSSLLMSAAQIIVNSFMTRYDAMALAGMGVAMKVTMVTGTLCIGFGQGVQPLLGWCVRGGRWDRYKEIMRFSLICALGTSAVLTAGCYAFSEKLVGAFLTEPTAYAYALSFTRILLSTSILFGVFFLLTNALQAMGAATPAFLISLSRQGFIYIPALFLLHSLLGVTGLVWAQPASDLLSTLLVIVLYRITLRKYMSGESTLPGGAEPQPLPR